LGGRARPGGASRGSSNDKSTLPRLRLRPRRQLPKPSSVGHAPRSALGAVTGSPTPPAGPGGCGGTMSTFLTACSSRSFEACLALEVVFGVELARLVPGLGLRLVEPKPPSLGGFQLFGSE